VSAVVVVALIAAAVPDGRYIVADSSAADIAVAGAVDAAVADLPFFVRPFAARTLREALVTSHEIVLHAERKDGHDVLRVGFGGYDVVSVDGVAGDAIVDDHGVARVQQSRVGDVVTQTAARPEGTRTLRIAPVVGHERSVDVDVRFESPQLTRPVFVRLRYRRA
jgi:hypothetical protein